MQLPASASMQFNMQLEATIASEMIRADDGYGDEDEASHEEHILAPAALRRRQLQPGLAVKTCRISHSSDVYRDTPGYVIPGASNSRDTALDRIWAWGRFILSPIIAMISTLFGQCRVVPMSSSSFQLFVVADRRHALQKIKPETKLVVSEVEVAPGIILGSLSVQDFRFITSLRCIEEH